MIELCHDADFFEKVVNRILVRFVAELIYSELVRKEFAYLERFYSDVDFSSW